MLRVTSNERTTVERLRTTSTLFTTVAGGVFNLCLHARNVYTHTLASFQRTARRRKVTRELPEGACVMLCRAVPSALLVYLSCIAAAVEGRLAGVEVELANGNVSGHSFGPGLYEFLGIPYAESTATARWKAPVKKQPWSPATLDATKFGHPCPGFKNARTANLTASEDCLSLNVWTSKDAEKLPVLVWVHGGGFCTGTSADPLYTGRVFAQHKAVLVTVNYRLGALGFLPSEDGRTANFGLRDQALALQWVQENIDRFGGDAQRVTLFGQSAGAMSVLAHLASPASRGLFVRAASFSPVAIHCRSLTAYAAHAKTLFHSVGCHEDDYDCMRSKDFRDIVKHQMLGEYMFHFKDGGRTQFLPWIPACGDDFLPQDPASFLVYNGTYPGIEGVVMGNVKDEMGYFVPVLLNSSITTNGLIDVVFSSKNKNLISSLYAQNDGERGDEYMQLVDLLSDYLVACYVRHLARGMTVVQNNAPVYLYEFEHAPSYGANVDNWSHRGCTGMPCHASDNVFNFQSVAYLENASFTQYELALSEAMMGSLVDFAYGKDGLFFPYATKEDMRLQWGVPGSHSRVYTTNTQYRSKFCAVWDRLGWGFT